METFKASVQYGDWHGTAAADNIDPVATSIHDYLEKKGLSRENDFLLAIQLYAVERSVYVRAYLLEDHEDYESAEQTLRSLEDRGEPIPVREVSLELTLEKFFAMFKRFAVTLTKRDLPLEGRQYSATEE